MGDVVIIPKATGSFPNPVPTVLQDIHPQGLDWVPFSQKVNFPTKELCDKKGSPFLSGLVGSLADAHECI